MEAEREGLEMEYSDYLRLKRNMAAKAEDLKM